MKHISGLIGKSSLLIILLFSLISLSGCNYQDQIDDLKVRVDALESAMQKLQQAYQDGKIIAKAESFSEGEGGYYITFSDGTTVVLNNGSKGTDGVDGKDGADGVNGADGADGKPGADGADGKDGVTPMLKIDDEGYWCVSYDGGHSYERVVDTDGNPVYAHGRDGNDGNDGVDGTPGADGKDGKNGLCVRVEIKEGRYVFVVYDPDDPDNIIEEIPTLYTVEPGSVLQSIVRDEKTGIITLTMADGTVFQFNLDVCYPTSILLLTESVTLPAAGSGVIKFRVNPSNAYIDYSTEGVMPGVELDVVGTRYGYVTSPVHYKLDAVAPDRDEVGRIVPGQYYAYIRDLGLLKGYNDKVALVINTHDGRGDVVQITSSTTVDIKCGVGTDIESLTLWDTTFYPDANNNFNIRVPFGESLLNLTPEVVSNALKVYPEGTEFVPGQPVSFDLSAPVTLVAVSGNGDTARYKINATFSDLPTVYVNSPSEIASREEWVKECSLSIANTVSGNVELSKVQIKGRGNSSWLYPKKSYTVKLDKKSEILGMARHKRWCLLANWMDRTLLRNDVAFEVGRRMTGLDWTPHGKFVELVLNGRHVGNYYLCEQIRVDANRVPVTEMTSADVDDVSITGGYLIEMDVNFDETFKFHTIYRKLPVMVQSPDDDVMVDAQFKYIENYVNRIEKAIYPANKPEYIGDLIDMASFADWLIVNELLLNTEPSWPKSTYMHKDRGGKMIAGPIWDYDYYTFVPGKDQWFLHNSLWYNGLFKFPEFAAIYKERWELHKAALATIPEYIDNAAKKLVESDSRNIRLWPITTEINGDEKLGFADAVSRLKSSYIERYKWMDKTIGEM